MKRKVLKLVVGNKPDTVKIDECDNNSWWYLHGQLEDDVHYDKATVINCKSLGLSRETKRFSGISWGGRNDGYDIKLFDNNPWHEMYFTGVINVDIEGISKRCVGYFWVTEEKEVKGCDETFGEVCFPVWHQRGLVCYADDLKAIKYAEEEYNNKSSIL